MAAHLTGSFNNSGSPVIKITVYGVFEQAKREFEAIVDTGFTGFLLMPLVQAFPLGLVLIGTTSVILADGTSSEKLMALGNITLGERTEAGVVLLGGNQTDILIGMQFLRTFQKTFLLVEGGFFVLIDNEEVKKAIRQALPQPTSEQPAPSEPGTDS